MPALDDAAVEALRVLAETRLYFELGFPSLPAYADSFFQLRRAEVFEHVRVAKALLDLTRLREAFAAGRIGWSVLKAITRVATDASQESWIGFARAHGVERTLAEARAKVEAVAADVKRRAEALQAQSKVILEEGQRQLTEAVEETKKAAAAAVGQEKAEEETTAAAA